MQKGRALRRLSDGTLVSAWHRSADDSKGLLCEAQNSQVAKLQSDRWSTRSMAADREADEQADQDLWLMLSKGAVQIVACGRSHQAKVSMREQLGR